MKALKIAAILFFASFIVSFHAIGSDEKCWEGDSSCVDTATDNGNQSDLPELEAHQCVTESFCRAIYSQDHNDHRITHYRMYLKTNDFYTTYSSDKGLEGFTTYPVNSALSENITLDELELHEKRALKRCEDESAFMKFRNKCGYRKITPRPKKTP